MVDCIFLSRVSSLKLANYICPISSVFYINSNSSKLAFIHHSCFARVLFLKEQSKSLCRLIEAPFGERVAEEDKFRELLADRHALVGKAFGTE